MKFLQNVWFGDRCMLFTLENNFFGPAEISTWNNFFWIVGYRQKNGNLVIFSKFRGSGPVGGKKQNFSKKMSWKQLRAV